LSSRACRTIPSVQGYRICPEVVHETVDGEVVIIHLGTGVYYSIRGRGVSLWEGAVAGATSDSLARVAPTEAESFLRELEGEGLIERADGSDATWQAPDAVDGEPAVLERFDDMEDLLLLDPVHEVDDQGWPHAR
jgi:hypothetical protein